jgi:hypothetical protein
MSTDLFTHTECANLTITKATCQDLHHKLGHPHKQGIIDTAKHYGIKLNTDCAISKIRVKNFGYNDENQATRKGERFSIDISSIQHISYGGAKFWLLIQDKYTNYCWSYFLSAKSNLSEVVIQHIKTFQKEHDLIVKFCQTG